MNACEACYICAALHKAMCSSDYRIKAIELQHSAYSNDFTFYENSDIVLFYYNLSLSHRLKIFLCLSNLLFSIEYASRSPPALDFCWLKGLVEE